MQDRGRCDDEIVGADHFAPLGQIGPNLGVLARHHVVNWKELEFFEYFRNESISRFTLMIRPGSMQSL